MGYETFTCDIDADGVALVTIDLPGQSMNVWNAALMRDYRQFVDRLNTDDAIKGAVITSGKASGFLAGADLKLISTRKAETMREAFESSFVLSDDLRRMETGGHDAKRLARGAAAAKPVACVVNGLALGGGLELVLACHYRSAVDDPRVQLGLPEVTIGLLPGGGGTQRLLRLIGVEKALKMVLAGTPVDPHTAKAYGFIDEVVPADQAMGAALAWVKANPRVVQPWDRADFIVPGVSSARDPQFAQLFANANALAEVQSGHNYDAVPAILSCFYEGTLVPIDTALRIESKYFTKLLTGAQSRNMIRTLFVNKQAADKGAQRPREIAPVELRKVGIVGAGLMGCGIAHVAAKGKLNVVVLDKDRQTASKASAYTKRIVEKAVQRGAMSADAASALLARIVTTDRYEDFADADLVIEAVFEQPGIKADVLRNIEAVVGEQVVIASNTSTLPIAGLARHLRRPERFIGMHFFSPVERMQLLEIIPGEATGRAALAAAYDFNARIRKTPILVKDVRGFYTNQVVPPYLNEAVLMLMEGVDPALIDNVAIALGMPIGPLALLDETTLSLAHDIQRSTREQLGEAYQPAGTEAFFEKMVVELDRKGRRFGGGIYEYSADGTKTVWRGLIEHYPRAGVPLSPEQVEQRLLYIQLTAAARCLEAGIVVDPQSADLGAIFGWGFPTWTGGPMSHIDTLGLAEFVVEADRLAQRYGARFKPPASLRDKAGEGLSLYAPV